MEFMNSLDQIIGVDDRQVIEVDVPEWSTRVRLRAMTGTDRDAYEVHVTNGGKQGAVNLIGMRSKLVAACLVNDRNERIVSPKDEVKLGEKSAKVLNDLFEKCLSLNGMTEDDVKELEANFEDTPAELSTSD